MMLCLRASFSLILMSFSVENGVKVLLLEFRIALESYFKAVITNIFIELQFSRFLQTLVSNFNIRRN